MRAEARAEGFGMLDTLVREWGAGTLRFDRAGEALFGVFEGTVLAGIGGMTVEPMLPGTLRMRRFYVRRPYRGIGAGRRLAEALLHQVEREKPTVTVNAAAGSEAFWEALGFKPDRRDGRTHILKPG
jgi:GNAT superfamily N-acetyltransferase